MAEQETTSQPTEEVSWQDNMQSIADQLFNDDGSYKEQDAGEGAEEGDDAASAAEAAEDATGGEDTDSPEDGEEREAEDQEESEESEGEDSPEPPESWSAEEKKQFEQLPSEAQKIVAAKEQEREQQLSEKTKELEESQERYKAFDEILKPRERAWAMNGTTPDQAVRQLLHLSDYAAENPEQFLQWFAQQRGLDLQRLAGGSQSDDDEYVDPELKSLRDEVRQLRQERDQEKHQSAQSQQAQIQQVIQDFAQDTESHPYFEELQGEIAAQLPGVRQANPQASPKEHLETAYQKAVWANETTRKKEIERQRKADEAERRKKSKASADKAKKAAGTNVRSKGSPPGGESPKSMEETMAEAYDRAQGAG